MEKLSERILVVPHPPSILIYGKSSATTNAELTHKWIEKGDRLFRFNVEKTKTNWRGKKQWDQETFIMPSPVRGLVIGHGLSVHGPSLASRNPSNKWHSHITIWLSENSEPEISTAEYFEQYFLYLSTNGGADYISDGNECPGIEHWSSTDDQSARKWFHETVRDEGIEWHFESILSEFGVATLKRVIEKNPEVGPYLPDNFDLKSARYVLALNLLDENADDWEALYRVTKYMEQAMPKHNDPKLYSTTCLKVAQGYEKDGRLNCAIEFYNKAALANPNSKAAREGIKRLS